MDTNFWKPIIAGQVRHLVTVAAGMLVAAGAVQSDQQAQFISIASGIVMWLLIAAWSWWQKVGQKRLQEQFAKAKLSVAPKAPAASGATKAVVAFLIVSAAALALAMPSAHAQTYPHRIAHHATVPLPKADPRGLSGLYDAATTPQKPLTASQAAQNPLLLIQTFALNDLQAALSDAQAQTPPDTVAISCYQALIALKTNPAFTLPSGKVAGAFTAIQKARDLKTQLANLASPTGPLAGLNAACAAWNQDNITTLIAVAGAVGLVANPAGTTAAATGALATFNAQILSLLAALAPK